MGIESNKEAVAMMKNALGSIENRFREAYNKGYKDGIKEGINQAMQKIADSILEEVEAEPQMKHPCDTCANKGDHVGECQNCVADSAPFRLKTPSHYKPKDESQPRCPKCGERGYIRSLESMGVKLKVFDEYKWKCTNCNKYFKEEPKDEPQTDCAWGKCDD